jgi:hypothetical protein
MGRSRGGLTTKIHALVDANGLPIALKLTAGQAHDGRSAADMFDTLSDGDVLLGDRVSDSDTLRIEMRLGAFGPISSPCQTASAALSSAHSFIVIAISSIASSANSSSYVLSPRAMTSEMITSSPQQLAATRIWLRHNQSVT